MKKYIVPEMEIEEVSSEDIITSSYELKAGEVEEVTKSDGEVGFISGVDKIL
ncbi:MAG: hypothetical protein ACI3XX_03185 [Eubacteriales bacterium]